MAGVPNNSIILFPYRENILCCGLAGIVSFKNKNEPAGCVDIDSLDDIIIKTEAHCLTYCKENDLSFDEHYLGGSLLIESFKKAVYALKGNSLFVDIMKNRATQNRLSDIARRLKDVIDKETKLLSDTMGRLGSMEVDIMSARIEDLKDIRWCITSEIITNIEKVSDLSGFSNNSLSPSVIITYKNINAVLNSIDRLEVRGRDSAGISLMFILGVEEFKRFKERIDNEKLSEWFNERADQDVLVNNAITLHKGKELAALTLTYKVAAEIGSLGDNISFIRKQIQNDPVLKVLVEFPFKYHTVSAHTRWASVGGITEANCHPVDNKTKAGPSGKTAIIHACLNGDIDNYLELKNQYESSGDLIPEDITTDTKIIPLQIQRHLTEGHDIEEAFRLAVNDFEGSHAIAMHSDLAPGRLFLAQRGSGQAIFVGIADEHYMPASEVYGFVEETPYFIRLDGEKVIDGKNGKTQGQIFVLNQDSSGGLEGIKAMFYDSTPLEMRPEDIKQTDITSRDIDRQEYPHYFLKEISESPASVEKTLQNRWKVKESDDRYYEMNLDEKVVPRPLQKALKENKIRHIYFMGQGTAGVAAHACADILNYYMNDRSMHVSALKASELSGFRIDEDDDRESMSDSLVIAITQSGTTTDTNRTVDMVKERGAWTMAIVNRRDSDITFKVDGVIHTSSGRDIEMSVASTKAFYSQIVAGAILGLYIASLKGQRNDEFVTEEVKQLLLLPDYMQKVLCMRDKIRDSAAKVAVTRTYWAAVGSGPNKASADEIRIKLSELCYKTISTDYVEDKKHIDLSSEPLIIVCAAGTRDTVIGDIIKDTAIFQAHKALPIVIADEGEKRFAPYAEDVFHVPPVSEHLAPILNTLVGHIWGYYAALTINEGSRFLHKFRGEIQDTVDEYAVKGLDVFEVILEHSFREKIARFYNEFRAKKAENRFPAIMGLDSAANLTLLLKYLYGRLPVTDFELDFNRKGTPLNMLNSFLECIGDAINCLARPIDAIKHQAKTVTVGTSRISEKVEGLLFNALTSNNFTVSQITTRNVIVLKNLQNIISGINGSTLYKVNGLDILGEPTEETTIEVVRKEGTSKNIASRVEKDSILRGEKKIIVSEGNVYMGKGRKDRRSILVIPVISTSSDTENMTEHLLLLNVSFKKHADLPVKKKALGGKYERIKNLVQENSIQWDDNYLEFVEMPDLFGNSAEKIVDSIISQIQ